MTREERKRQLKAAKKRAAEEVYEEYAKPVVDFIRSLSTFVGPVAMCEQLGWKL